MRVMLSRLLLGLRTGFFFAFGLAFGAGLVTLVAPPRTHRLRTTETPEQAAQRVARMQQDLIQRHAAERLDPDWSAQASRAFTVHLQTLEKHASFELTSAECRSDSCLARIHWPRCLDSQAGTQRLAEAIIREPSDPLFGFTLAILQARPSPVQLFQACDGLYALSRPAPRSP